jgi:hypothetical protein
MGYQRIVWAVAAAATVVLTFTTIGAASPASAAGVPKNKKPPSISGTPREGSQLTADKGDWDGGSLNYAYQWQRCNSSGSSCSNIGGATAQKYTATSTDVGSRLRVVLTATNSDGTGTASSAPTDVISAKGTAPTNTSPPTISGTPREGATLTANPGSWSGTATIAYNYTWQRCTPGGGSCGNVGGGQTYSVRAGDVGRRLRVVVTASNGTGKGTAVSALTDIVQPGVGPTNTRRPAVIGGTDQEGTTLTADPGGWAGATGLAYQWLRCDASGNNCVPIPGATGRTYVVTAADIGHRLRVAVTATGPAGSRTERSPARGPIRGRGPADQIKLPNGRISIPITSVLPPQRLIVDRVEYSPARVVSRNVPLVVRFHVVDTRGYVIRGALVYAVGVPFNRISTASETSTGTDGWATITFRILPTLTLRRGNLLVLFVRARKGGENPLAGVSTRRLVSVRLG